VREAGAPGDIIEALARVFSFGQAHPDLAGKEWQTILDGLRHIALPALVLTYFNMAGWVRYTRTSMLEVLRQDYMRTARAKGLGEPAVISRHVFRNSLIPVVTLLGPVLVELIAGSFVIEAMFGFPGFGREYWDALVNLDYGMIAGVTLLYAGLIVFVNLLVEMLYGVLDPRVRGE